MTENKSIQEIQPKQAKKGIPMPLKAVGVGVGLGIASLIGCPTEPESQKCNCPNGTVHPEGTSMPCCDGEGCNCIAIREYIIDIEGMKPITIEDATGGLVSEGNLALIKSAIEIIYGDNVIPKLSITEGVIIRVENAPIYENNKNAKMVSPKKMAIRSEFLFQATTEIELGPIVPVFAEMDNLLTVAKVKSIITPKPVITPRQLAAFEKAGRNVNRIVSRGHQNVRLG
jgi:hypothetical protein